MRKVLLCLGLGALLIATLVGLSACGGSKPLPAEEAQTFAEQIDPLSENLLTAINAGDQAAHVRDMEEKMRAASNEEAFKKLETLVKGKIGQYISKEMTSVYDTGDFRSVVYSAKFEGEEGVTVRVVYNMAGDTPLVSGLWLDSPKLRQK